MIEFKKPLRYRPFINGDAVLTSINAADLWSNLDDKIYHPHNGDPKHKVIHILYASSGSASGFIFLKDLTLWAPPPLFAASTSKNRIIPEPDIFEGTDYKGCLFLSSHWEAYGPDMITTKPLTNMDKKLILYHLNSHQFI